MRGYVVQPSVHEAGRSQVLGVFTVSVNVGNGPAGEPLVQQSLAGRIQRPAGPDKIGDDDPSTGPQHPSGLLIEGGFVGCVAHALHRPHDIETGIWEGRRSEIGHLEVDAVGQPAPGCVAARLLDLPGGQGDPDHVSAALLGQPQAAAADPAPGIQHPCAGLDLDPIREDPVHVLERVGMAAGVLVRVAEVDGQVVRV